MVKKEAKAPFNFKTHPCLPHKKVEDEDFPFLNHEELILYLGEWRCLHCLTKCVFGNILLG